MLPNSRLLVALLVVAPLVLGGCGHPAAEDAAVVQAPRPDQAIAADEEEFDEAALQPGVADYIAENFLGHAAEFPDANESLAVLRAFVEHGPGAEQVERFTNLVAQNPSSRHAHIGLGLSLWERYSASGVASDADLAFDHIAKAVRLGVASGHVRYLDALLDATFATGRVQEAEAVLAEALAKRPGQYGPLFAEATIAARLGRADAESLLTAAYAHRPNVDAAVELQRYYLDHDVPAKAAAVALRPDETSPTFSFFRGVALERLGRGAEASAEYASFSDMSQTFPASAKYRISGSTLQQGIRFEDPEETKTLALYGVSGDGQTNLSWVAACEAGGEPAVVQQAVAYSVRHRAIRGTIKVNSSTCISVAHPSSTLATNYTAVICQSSQYVGVSCSATAGNVTKCTNSNKRSSSTDDVAYRVWNGLLPDHTTSGGDYCPATGITPACLASCATQNQTSYHSSQAHSFLAQKTCKAPYSCTSVVGKICYADTTSTAKNCFFSVALSNTGCDFTP